MAELKPCPFCGDEYVQAEIYFPLSEFRIYCTGGEGCVASMTLSFEDAGIVDQFLLFKAAVHIVCV